jgi:hypothetical protein
MRARAGSPIAGSDSRDGGVLSVNYIHSLIVDESFTLNKWHNGNYAPEHPNKSDADGILGSDQIHLLSRRVRSTPYGGHNG